MDLLVLALLRGRGGDKVAFRTSLPSRELVAHEAAHVLQYRNGRSEGGDPEVEADRAANLVASGQQVAVQVIGTGGPHLKPGDPFPGDTIKALKAVDPSGITPAVGQIAGAVRDLSFFITACSDGSPVFRGWPKQGLNGGIFGAPSALLKSN